MTFVDPGSGSAYAGSLSLGWGSNQDGTSQEFSNGIRTSTGGTVDTASHSDTKLIDTPSAAATSGLIAVISAWESDGLRLNVTTASSVDRLLGMLLIEEDRIAATGTLHVAAADFTSTGSVNTPATASLHLAAPDFTATGSLRATGTASLHVSAPDFNATGSLKANGTCTLHLAAPDFNATGSLLVTGTAALHLAAPDFNATGQITVVGSAALHVAAPSISTTAALTDPARPRARSRSRRTSRRRRSCA